MSFVKKITTLLSGTVIAQVLTFLSYPLLTYWLAPEQWASLGIFSAFVGVFSVWACGGLEATILLPKNLSHSFSLWRIARRWGIYMGLFASVVLVCCMIAFPRFFSAYCFNSMVVMLGLSVFLEGGIISTMQWNNRVEAFGVMSQSRMIQAVSTLLFSLLLALVVPKYNGILVYAWVMGQAIAYGWLRWMMVRQLQIHNVLKQPDHLAFAAYAHFPIPSMLSSFLNALSRQLPFFILPFFGSAAWMGNFTLAHKVLTAPIAFIGASLTQIFNIKSSQGSTDHDALHNWSKRWLLVFMGVAFIPLLVILIFGPFLFSFFFGFDYTLAGNMAALLAPWIFLLYWINPLSHLINVHQELRKHLYYNTIVLFLRGVSLWVLGSWLGFEAAVAGFGAIGFLAALYMATWLWRLSKGTAIKLNNENQLNGAVVKIVFTGDVAFTGCYAQRVLNNEEVWSADVQALLNNADATVVNWEGACMDSISSRKQGQPILQTFEAMSFCVKRGINVFNLANNHIHDVGLKQAMATKQHVEALGEMALGLNDQGKWNWTPQYICLSNLTIALIAVHEDEEKINLFQFRKQIKSVRSVCDYIVLNYHGGEEYSDIPFPFKKRRLLSLIHEDIDVIVAHHPHVVQPMQQVGKKWIFYSLGNFIFDIVEHRGRGKTTHGALLQLNFFSDRIEPHWMAISMDNDKGWVTLAENAWLTHLQSRWESKRYLSLWTEECHRIRHEEKQLTQSLLALNTTAFNNKQKRSKWKSIFNPTRRTLLVGDWIFRLIIK